MFETLANQVNSDASLVRLGRGLTGAFMIQVGETEHHIAIEAGRVTAVEQGPFRMRGWSFAIRAPREVWEVFWQTHPPAGFHDIFAMSRFGHCTVEGDVDVLLSHLRYVKSILALPRAAPADGSGGGNG